MRTVSHNCYFIDRNVASHNIGLLYFHSVSVLTVCLGWQVIRLCASYADCQKVKFTLHPFTTTPSLCINLSAVVGSVIPICREEPNDVCDAVHTIQRQSQPFVPVSIRDSVRVCAIVHVYRVPSTISTLTPATIICCTICSGVLNCYRSYLTRDTWIEILIFTGVYCRPSKMLYIRQAILMAL